MIRTSLRRATGPLGAFMGLTLLGLGAAPAMAQQGDRVVLGVGVAAGPAYQGAEDYRVLPLPAIDIAKGMFFANLRNGIGFAPLDTAHVSMGGSVVFVQGIRGQDLPAGIDRIADSVGFRLFTTLRGGGFIANVAATRALGGTKGTLVDASLSYPVVASPRLVLVPTIAATWANAKYNDRYFGVTAAEALASGLPQFSTGAGIKDVSAALTANYRLTGRLSLTATASVSTLTGDVKDSPIVRKETAPFGILALSYRF